MNIVSTGRRPPPEVRALSVMVTSMASDAHTWNLVYLQLVLEELGHDVTNLGACVPDDLLVEQCLRRRPDLVVISSVNGHGSHDGHRVIQRLRAHPELAHTAIVIGGKLGISGDRDTDRAEPLLAAGFDAVFDDDSGAERLRRFIGELLATVPVPAESVTR